MQPRDRDWGWLYTTVTPALSRLLQSAVRDDPLSHSQAHAAPTALIAQSNAPTRTRLLVYVISGTSLPQPPFRNKPPVGRLCLWIQKEEFVAAYGDQSGRRCYGPHSGSCRVHLHDAPVYP